MRGEPDGGCRGASVKRGVAAVDVRAWRGDGRRIDGCSRDPAEQAGVRGAAVRAEDRITPRTTLTPMRVHLGSDHAGLELKEHMLGWLRDHGHEPVDHGPFVLRRARRLPGVLPPRRGGGRRRPRAASGVVIGGSGNGEQIAANKVPRRAGGAGVERGDRAPRPRAQRRQRDLRRRPDAHGRGDDPLHRGLPRHRVHRRGAARTPDRDARRLRGDRRPAAAAGVRASGLGPDA